MSEWNYWDWQLSRYRVRVFGWLQRLVTRNRPLHFKQTEQALINMVAANGQPLDKLELEKTWDTFTKFCELPVETLTDAVLIQWGIQAYYEGELGNFKITHEEYYLSFLRQVENDFMEYEQIECRFDYAIDDELRKLDTANAWCFFDNFSKRHNYPDSNCDLKEFLENHRQGKIFQALKHRQPIRTTVIQQSTD